MTPGRGKRLKSYHEAAQIWHDEAPELFLFQGEMIDGARNEVEYKARGRSAHHPVRHFLSLICRAGRRRPGRAPGARLDPRVRDFLSRSSGTP